MSPVICPSCGKPAATARQLPMYRYKESGIPNLWLKGGVTETVCASCGTKHLKIEKESQLLQFVALNILEDPRPLTGHEMRFLRGAARMSQASLAEVLRLRRETIAERESKDNPGIDFADEVVFRLVVLWRFNKHLQTKGNNFLTEIQSKRLDNFTNWFLKFSQDFVQEMRKKSTKMVATMDDEEVWRLDKAA
jgi:putative transcriptional regulator